MKQRHASYLYKKSEKNNETTNINIMFYEIQSTSTYGPAANK